MFQNLGSIKREFLEEALEDYVGLWQFPQEIRRHSAPVNPQTIKDLSIRLVRELVGEGLFVPGELTENGGFDPWPLSAQESITRIEQLWEDLGREPNLGDDAPWFDLTKKGERVVLQAEEGRR